MHMLIVHDQLSGYLFYADNVIIFLDATAANYWNLHNIFVD